MSKIADFVKLKSGYANFVNLKADFAKAEGGEKRARRDRPCERARGVPGNPLASRAIRAWFRLWGANGGDARR
jgi:hypothetical protein